MKKIILSAAVIAIASFATVQASEVKDLSTKIVVTQDSVTKTPVKLEELPDSVKVTLASETYKDWAPTEAWFVKDGTKEYYLINVKKEEEIKAVKLDKDGKPVE
jgi:hypothetical protein